MFYKLVSFIEIKTACWKNRGACSPLGPQGQEMIRNIINERLKEAARWKREEPLPLDGVGNALGTRVVPAAYAAPIRRSLSQKILKLACSDVHVPTDGGAELVGHAASVQRRVDVVPQPLGRKRRQLEGAVGVEDS